MLVKRVLNIGNVGKTGFNIGNVGKTSFMSVLTFFESIKVSSFWSLHALPQTLAFLVLFFVVAMKRCPIAAKIAAVQCFKQPFHI